MSLIKGIEVTLYERYVSGYDGFDAPIYAENEVVVPNVLVSPTSSENMADALMVDKVVYQLAIPKGDCHSWKGCRVSFFGRTFKVVGDPIEGIESMIPLDWNKKVSVASYE